MNKIFSFGSSRKPALSSDQQNTPQEVSGISAEGDVVVHSCMCCGTFVKLPESIIKYKCSVCQSTVSLVNTIESGAVTELSLHEMKKIIRQCRNSPPNSQTSPRHSVFKPLERYLIHTFGSIEILNKSFQKKSEPAQSIKSYNLNYDEVDELFTILTSLPTKRPYFKVLLVINDILRRPPVSLTDEISLRWLLILFELPTLADCLYHERKPKTQTTKSHLDTPEVKSLSYEIIKRIIGYLSHSSSSNLEALAQTFVSHSLGRFSFKVQLINLYITFHLTRLVNKNYTQKDTLKQFNSLRINEPESPNYSEYNDSAKLNSSLPSTAIVSPTTTVTQIGSIPRHHLLQLPISLQSGFSSWSDNWNFASNSNKEIKNSDIKLRASDYGHEWHIKSAARLLSVFYASNKKRLPIYSFYNTLVDCIQVKQDFEIWQNVFHPTKDDDPNRVFYDIIKSGGLSTATYNNNRTTQFSFCQYPFLLSLGAKISILEYEARRTMERKAEEAFIKAIDKRRIMDVNLRIQVRRSHITNDSMRAIKNHQGELQKALKIEFIGEAGIDAGGLKKEWFLLLTKSLFNQENGMFYYNEESNLCWFAPMPLERTDELYFMVGVVLGLAIYNSTILDLKFPLALYKKLLGKKVTLEDYTELFPSTGKGLYELLHYKGDISDLSLYFDTTFDDSFGNRVVEELIPGGSNTGVTNNNCRSYVNKWVDFYLNKVIEPQFASFFKGFQSVIGGNALSLFAPKEIEMIICGNNETKIDTESFKSITKYAGWVDELEAKKSCLYCWFWEWFDNLSYTDQKKFLSFVTGSDRIPATGVSTMSFKITKIQSVLKVKRLPVAHTCFNELCLYEYETKGEMVRKLNFSINESEGFGLR